MMSGLTVGSEADSRVGQYHFFFLLLVIFFFFHNTRVRGSPEEHHAWNGAVFSCCSLT